MKFQIISKPRQIYVQMLKDIKSAKKRIFLETHIFSNDEVGEKFKKALLKKASEGVKIRLLIDAYWSVNKEYFKELIEQGAEVRFCREFKYVLRIVSKNHERNHRKLLIIDKDITYIGSANITALCLTWRELVLRLQGKELNMLFAKAFMGNWRTSANFSPKKIKTIACKSFKIIRDIPSRIKKPTYNRYIRLINKAQKEIQIETPYLVPSFRIIKALSRAVKRGVDVKLIIPRETDVKVHDILRDTYLGMIHKRGIQIFYYTPGMLHSKLLIIDNTFFLLGSSNLDYRSFLHQYEINLLGEDKGVIKALKKYSDKTLSKTKPFKYQKWKNRKIIKRFLEFLLWRIKEYF
jgi:cardiolipin synthase